MVEGGALVACVARVVDAEVGGDTEEPGAEAGLGAVGLARAIDAQEDLLGEFLGDGLVVHHAVHEVDDRPAVLLNEEIEAGHIAGAQLHHDGGVFHLGEVRGALRGEGGSTPSRRPGLTAKVAISCETPSLSRGCAEAAKSG